MRGIVPKGVAVPPFAEIKDTLSPFVTRKFLANEEPIINSSSLTLSKLFPYIRVPCDVLEIKSGIRIPRTIAPELLPLADAII